LQDITKTEYKDINGASEDNNFNSLVLINTINTQQKCIQGLKKWI